MYVNGRKWMLYPIVDQWDFGCPRKWQPNEEQRLEDATLKKAVAKYGAQKGGGFRGRGVELGDAGLGCWGNG